jgi:predicted nucleotidyltransferase
MRTDDVDDARFSDETTLLDVLDRATKALEQADVDFLVIGGIGSSVWGRDRGLRDIDLFVRPEAADRALEVLGADGFDTSVAFEHWLYKARRDGITVDVIFRSSRDVLLSPEMLARAQLMEFRGRTLRVAPPEDLIIMKAIAADEDTARYWYDAVAMLSTPGLDWDYLVERGRHHGVRRILSLLLFAASVDLPIPQAPMDRLYEMLKGTGG